MDPSEELCLCFHVSRGKVEKFIRVERPRAASQLAQCYGAGTGCGWCRPFLKKLFEAGQIAAAEGPSAGGALREGSPGEARVDELPTSAEYAAQRTNYIRQGKGSPPGSERETPLGD
jgi:bacterioferritin-associated ferredoxin